MRGEICGQTVVDRQRVDTDTARLRFFKKHVDRVHMEAGEVHFAPVVRISELRRSKTLLPSCILRDTGTCRNWPVGSDPSAQIVRRDLRVRIGVRLFANVDNGQRTNKGLDGNFVDSRATIGEVQGGIDMCACVFGYADLCEIKGVFCLIKNLFVKELLFAKVGGEIMCQSMGHIDDAVRRLCHERS